jgi:hypothetical protein
LQIRIFLVYAKIYLQRISKDGFLAEQADIKKKLTAKRALLESEDSFAEERMLSCIPIFKNMP